MIPFTAVNHISVTVTDLEKAKSFYGGVLGLREIPRPGFRFPGVWYALQDSLIPLRPVDPLRFDTRDPHFALAVADADDAHARLQAGGLPFYDFADTPTGRRQLFVRDPEGNMIELIGPTKDPRVRRAAAGG